jgi:hypothetical protein
MFHTNIQETERERNSLLEVFIASVSLLSVATLNRRAVPFLENT